MDKITFDFKNRTAIVTGGAQGFGFDIAKRFLKSGAKVIIWDNDPKAIESAVKKINNSNLSSNVVDVSNYEEVEKNVKEIVKKSNIDISDFSNFSSTFQPYKSTKKEKYMNANQKKHFENILQAWKDALHEEQEKTENLIQTDQGNFPDSVDRASKEEEFMLELRKRDRERKLISKIEQSMKDLSDNFYGFCETCGIEIGIKRLEARPTATQCIDCKTIEEIKEKQQYG